MQGVLGIALLVIGGVLLYDVLAGKSQGLVGLLNGGAETGISQGTKPGIAPQSTPTNTGNQGIIYT